MSRPDRILVTGGAGFIGSHLIDRLVRSDFEIVVADDLSTGKLANIQEHLKKGRVDFIETDVRSLESVKKCVRNVDAVVHLAAIASVPFSVQHPSLTYKTNVDGTLNLLKSCLVAGVKKFVYVSSCSVYGESIYLPLDEAHPTRPISPYACSKLKAEHYCDVFQKKHGLGTVVFRLFNVYGSRQGFLGHSGVVTRFIESARRGLPLTIYGDGTQTRDFVHVADVAEAMLRALENGTADGETLNIGYGKPTSINELAEAIRTLMGTNVETIHEESMSGDVKRCFADISKSERFLGYKPEIALEDGLRGMLGEIPSNTFNRSAGS